MLVFTFYNAFLLCSINALVTTFINTVVMCCLLDKVVYARKQEYDCHMASSYKVTV